MKRLSKLQELEQKAREGLEKALRPERYCDCEWPDLSREQINDEVQKKFLEGELRNIEYALSITEKHVEKTGRDDLNCFSCGRPIEPERLICMPTTCFCSKCVRKNGSKPPPEHSKQQFFSKKPGTYYIHF